MSKKINTRIQVKSDTAANWNTASNAPTPFIPLEGEFIFIKDENEIKIGDGIKTVNELTSPQKQGDWLQTDETKNDFIKNKPIFLQTGSQTTISTEDSGENIYTFTASDGTTSTFVVKNGSKGNSPVRGTDYWTDADKAEIKAYVDEAILGGEW